MRIKIETITPAIAAKMLEGNTCNRLLRVKKIAEYANEMSAGRWMESGQGIIFLEDGTLGDGQHRLHAVIKSGVTIKIPVAYEVNPAAMGTFDTGAKRSVADYMHLHHGIRNANLVCASGKAIYCLSFAFQNLTITSGLMEVVIDQFGEQINDAVNVLHKFPQARKAWIIGSIAFAMKSVPELIGFAETLGTGEDAKRGDPALTFRNWLIAGTSAHLVKHFKTGAYEGLFNCLNAYASGTSLNLIRKGPTGINVFRAKQKKFIESVREEIKRLRS